MTRSEVRKSARYIPPKRRIVGDAARAVAVVVSHGGEHYDRRRHLARLIPVGPDEIADGRIEARRAILAKLARALRAERTRGRAGHWSYDINRHIGLKQAYEAERRALREATPGSAPEKRTVAARSGQRPSEP